MAYLAGRFCAGEDNWAKEFEKRFTDSLKNAHGCLIGMDFAKDYEQTKIKEMKTVKVIPQQEETISAASAVPNLCYFLDRKQQKVGVAVASCNGWKVQWSGSLTSYSGDYSSFNELVKEMTSCTSAHHDIIVMQIQK